MTYFDIFRCDSDTASSNKQSQKKVVVINLTNDDLFNSFLLRFEEESVFNEQLFSFFIVNVYEIELHSSSIESLDES